MTPTPASPTRPSPSDLQSHLYASFLQRKTADVALRISGSWTAVYRLHRVILIQAVRRHRHFGEILQLMLCLQGFFQSLFTSGFSESRARYNHRPVSPDYIDIVFDDPNITRAGESTASTSCTFRRCARVQCDFVALSEHLTEPRVLMPSCGLVLGLLML